MVYIEKLPNILAALSALTVGAASSLRGAENQNTYLKMVICLVFFYIIGLYIRSVLKTICEEQEEKNRQREIERLEEQEKKAREMQPEVGNNVDFRIEDSDDEEFTPLKISEVIRTNAFKQ